MRRKITISSLILLTIGLLVLLAPQLISVGKIQTSLVDRFSAAIGADVSIGSMHWRWAPLPHLTIFDSRIIHNDYEVTLPKTRIYPNWSNLLFGRVVPGRLYLRNPDVKVKSSFFSSPSTGAAPLALPNITIENGKVNIAAFKRDHIHVNNFTLSQLSVKVRKYSDNTDIVLKTNSSFAEHLSFAGTYFPSTSVYSGNVKSEKFQIERLLQSNSQSFTVLASEVDFSCEIIGQGTRNFQALFNGDVPDFSIKRLEKNAPLLFKHANLFLEKKGDEYGLKIHELHLAEPQASFTGQVHRYFDGDSTLPLYLLDLRAENINLSAVRSHLLTLLGDNGVTRTVCNVVRGGQAKSAHYHFNAPLDGFKNISEMTINVDVAKADIHVPGVELDLSESSGPIIIKDGSIHGHDLTSRLDSHLGSNGSFSLGLSDNNWLFKLDLDIDADLAKLPRTLHYLIDEEHFRNEVLKFSATGRKKGHLTIGDDLRDFTVDVRVPDMGGSEVHYERLSWPLSFQKGSLHVHGDMVSWQDVAAAIGPHEVSGLSGNASWADDTFPLEVTNIQARLDGKTFFSELQRYRLIKEILDENIASIEGAIIVDNGSAGGPFLHPALWQYSLDGRLQQVSLSTPHLPEPVLVTEGNLTFSDKQILLSEGNVQFFGSPLDISSTLSHSCFSAWQGSLLLDGKLSPAQSNWLMGKNWIPVAFSPKIHNHLKQLQISFSPDTLDIFGSLKNKSLSGMPVEVIIDVKMEKEKHLQTALHFFSDNDSAQVTITGDSRFTSPEIKFQGTLKHKTVAAIFNNPLILNGEVEGYFTITLPVSGKNGLLFNGQAVAHDLQWVWGNFLRQFTVSDLSMQGSGDKLTVYDANLLFEKETVHGRGEMTFTPTTVDTDLSLYSESLSQNTLTHFINDLSVFLNKITGLGQDETNTLNKNVSGQISIEADEFLFAETIKEGKEDSYRLTGLKGSIDFSNPEMTTLFLDNSSFCGLTINGTRNWKQDQSNKHFTLQVPEANTPYFEEFLPCVGVKDVLLSGRFFIDASLTDENGILSAGDFNLQARDGILMKMSVLSKIFKLINFTDLYQGLFSSGFRYKMMEIYGHVDNNLLILDKAVMEGEGMDIIAQGSINLHDMNADLTFFIVPFKSIDKIMNIVPLIGRIVGGKKRHIITYPVKVTGNLKEPEISVLSAGAIGKAAIDFVFDTITFPLDLIPGLVEDEKEYVMEPRKKE